MTNNSDEAVQWHALNVTEVLDKFKVDIKYGLNSDNVSARLSRDGYNVITEQARHSILNIVVRQFSDFMI